MKKSKYKSTFLPTCQSITAVIVLTIIPKGSSVPDDYPIMEK